MKNKIFAFIFFIMAVMIFGLMYMTTTAIDMYHKEKRNNEKAAKEFIKLALRSTIPEDISFKNISCKVHNLDDVNKLIKECCCTNSQKNPTL